MRLALAGVLALLAGATPAAASFSPPVELAHGGLGLGASVAVDASGASVGVLAGAGGAPRLIGRPDSVSPWSASEPLPGRELGRVAGPVVAAAGRGAAAIAWRIDTPRRYEAMAVMTRDPGGVFGAPEVVTGAAGDGVRHPALAVDARGDMVLAYNANTRATHLSMRGAIAINVRRAGDIVTGALFLDTDEHAGAPVVALAADGTGVVAWVRGRRVWAAAIDLAGGESIGRTVAVTGPGNYGALRAAAGPGGAATLAFRTRAADRSTAPYVVGAVSRPAGGSFAGRRVQVVERLKRRGFLHDLALAADEDGRATLAWSPEQFGQDRSVGVAGVTGRVRVAVKAAGAAGFGRARTVVGDEDHRCDAPSVAAAAGRAVIAYRCTDLRSYRVQVSTLDGSRLAAPQLLLTGGLLPTSLLQDNVVTAGLDDAGIATITILRPDPDVDVQHPAPVVERLLTTTGR